jgi:hypothetical protein
MYLVFSNNVVRPEVPTVAVAVKLSLLFFLGRGIAGVALVLMKILNGWHLRLRLWKLNVK